MKKIIIVILLFFCIKAKAQDFAFANPEYKRNLDYVLNPACYPCIVNHDLYVIWQQLQTIIGPHPVIPPPNGNPGIINHDLYVIWQSIQQIIADSAGGGGGGDSINVTKYFVPHANPSGHSLSNSNIYQHLDTAIINSNLTVGINAPSVKYPLLVHTGTDQNVRFIDGASGANVGILIQGVNDAIDSGVSISMHATQFNILTNMVISPQAVPSTPLAALDVETPFSDSLSYIVYMKNNLSQKLFSIHSNGTTNLHALAYTNNAAALAAGLIAGDIYYTDVAGEYILKIAH